MQFHRRFKEAIQRGDVTCTLRNWQRLRVKIGGQYNIHGYGAIEVTDAKRVSAGRVRLTDVRRAGFEARAELLDYLRADEADTVYLIEFRYLGSAPVRQPAKQRLAEEELTEMVARIEQFDTRSTRGPWAAATIKLIARHPGRRAPDLAAMISWDAAPFKANVRKLKALGLTESLEVGYRLSDRGRQVLEAL